MVLNSISLINIFFLFFFSFLLSFFLYFFKEKRLVNLSFSIKVFLFFFRFISFFLISILLFNPYIENKEEIIEKPILVIFQDNSLSITGNNDSSFYRSDYIDLINDFKYNIEKKFNVEFLLFGENIRKDSISFKDNFSNISSIFDYSENVFSNVNVGSYLLFSDGIFNKGKNPKYIDKTLNAPLHCLALGDTSKLKDVSIHSINYNKIGFPGNELPVEVNVEASNLKGEKIKLEVKSKNKIIYQKVIDVKSIDFLNSIFFYVKSKKPGLNKFDVSLSLVSSSPENNLSNNFSSFYIDIVNKEKNILMLYDSPHPDIAALKSAIQLDQQYKIDIYRSSDFNKDITKYDLVILYQCDLADSNNKKISKSNIPIWYIIGQESNFSKINSMQKTIYFQDKTNKFNEIYVSPNESFQKFILEDDVLEMINNSPPLLTSESFSINGNMKTFLAQKNISSNNKNPICFFSNNNECFLIAEGIWRWRLKNFLDKSNHDSFNLLIMQIVKNLLTEKNKDRFKLDSQSVYDFGDPVIFNAELYNENLEKVSNQEINFSLKNEENKILNYSFISIGDDYILNIGELNPGKYNFTANVDYDSKNFTKKGSFVVKNSLLENKITVANHDLLYNLSKQHNGILFQLNEINDIEKKILDSEYFQPIIHYENKKSALIKSIIPLILIFIFLFLEWFFRKKFIGY